MLPIKIDLNDLTPAHLEACKPHMGSCEYNSPCVIGTLMEPKQREWLAAEVPMMPLDEVGPLVHRGLISIPEEQLKDAEFLQAAFDTDNWDGVLQIAAKYMRPSE